MQSKEIPHTYGHSHPDSCHQTGQYYDLTIVYTKEPKVLFRHPREHKLAITGHEKTIAEADGVDFTSAPYDNGIGAYLLPRGGEAAKGAIRALKGKSKETKGRSIDRDFRTTS